MKPKIKKPMPPFKPNSHNQQMKAARNWRLPDKSSFVLNWDAQKTLWTGVLTIGTCKVKMPNGQMELLTFTTDADSVFKVMMTLDKQYKKWLNKFVPKDTIIK